MNEWKKVKIGDVLTERVGRYKPNDSLIGKYKRIEKIDFAGNIFISNKPSKTDMILVYPNDLIISGINVYKGAFAVYCGDEIVSATIHYSSYIFHSDLLDKDYFAYFLKSSAFLDILKKQVKGGIKTEIKAKTFLQLEIMLPDIDEQKHIVSNLSNKLGKIENLINENEKQREYIKKLRQSILQDAIEGKLTTEWRKDHPVIKGNLDFDSESLFEKIQQEKQKAQAGKKQKQLPPIADNEKAFEIPNSWKWVRLGEVGVINRGSGIKRCDIVEQGQPCILYGELYTSYGLYCNKTYSFITSELFARSKHFSNNAVVFTLTGENREDIAKSCAYLGQEIVAASGDLAYWEKHCLNAKYLSFFMATQYFSRLKQVIATGDFIIHISTEKLKSVPLILPPLAEQEEIVRIIDEKFAKLDLIEQEIKQRESYINSLKQSVMREVFEGESDK